MQFLGYILMYPVLWLTSKLPFRLLYFVSDILYVFLYKIVGYRKSVVRNNLKLVFPEKTDKERKIIEKKSYHHLCDMIVEAIKSISISESEMKKRYTFKNLEDIYKLEEEQRSVICFAGHYASWEWVFILQTHVKHKGYAVYKRLRNKYFDALVKKIRARYNSYLISTKETFKILTKAKNNNELTFNGFVFDQSPKLHKALHWQNFMGIKVPAYVGAEVLAKRLDMVTLFLNVKKVKRGYYEVEFIEIIRNPNDYKDYELTNIYLKCVENLIYDAPEYYLWTHKRWKHKDKTPK